MKFKEVIIVVLIMLIFAMAMLMYIVINDSIKASSVPIISNNIENITCGIFQHVFGGFHTFVGNVLRQ